MLANIKNRIRKVQAQSAAGEDLERIAELIGQGAYYDELTDDEKDLYCAYIGADREVMEAVEQNAASLHFQVKRKERRLTKAQLRDHIKATSEMIQSYIERGTEV